MNNSFKWIAVEPQPQGPGNHVAGEGQIWVCAACGKTSKDRYGEQKIDRGWDESCMLNSILCVPNPNYSPLITP